MTLNPRNVPESAAWFPRAVESHFAQRPGDPPARPVQRELQSSAAQQPQSDIEPDPDFAGGILACGRRGRTEDVTTRDGWTETRVRALGYGPFYRSPPKSERSQVRIVGSLITT